MDLKCYRWVVGGFYECWYVEAYQMRVWYRVITKDSPGRPEIHCRGTPVVENHPIRRWTHLSPHVDNSPETFEEKLFAGIPKELRYGS